MVYRTIQSCDQRAIIFAEMRVLTIECCSQAHIDHISVNEGSGGILNAGDDGSERTAAGILQYLNAHKFRFGRNALRTNAVNGSSYDAAHVSGMTERAIGRINEARFGGNK